MRLSRQVEPFLEMMSVERGASANTLAAYRRDLEAFLVEAGATRSLATFTRQDIERHMQGLAAEHMAPSTQARRLSALRQFFRFLYSEGLIASDPTEIVASPKKRRALPKVLSVDEVGLLLDTAALEARREGLSDAARLRALRLTTLLELLYATGMRVSELVSLPASAARSERPGLIIRGKGDRERLVPLTPAAQDTMRDWAGLMSARRRQGARAGAAPAASPFLFPASSASGHLTRQAFARDLKD
ncbi:MAG: site-specific integrase, partial [Hyphomicrobiaceae bacterium]|nr:site-specific integrase [Hyphomicrobiaceae bacterium]